MSKWFNLDGSRLVKEFKSDAERGLSSAEAEKRLVKQGPNQLHNPVKISTWRIFLEQFSDFMVIVLIGAAIISGLLGERADAITIVAIIILNAILGFFQEYRAEKSLEALKELTAPTANVIRDSKVLKIPARELVPGDILILESGDRVAADGRILAATDLEINEATLTGESLAVTKNAARCLEINPVLGDQHNMVFAGTAVTSGRGKVLVTATGMGTEIGKIAGMIAEAPAEETPLQRRLAQLGRWLVILCLGICAMVGTMGVLRGEPPRQMFLAAVSLAVAAIPEGLPAIVTIALAVGVQKMIRRNAIIRKLPAVETLGCATVICSDKTGTLTQNQMNVVRIWDGVSEIKIEGNQTIPLASSQVQLKKLLETGALCNNAQLENERSILKPLITGDPTEGALLIVAHNYGLNLKSLNAINLRIKEIAFSSERKRMGVWVQDQTGQGQVKLLVKGAADVILERCTSIQTRSGIVPLDQRWRVEIIHRLEEWGNDALRVLAFAYRDGVLPEIETNKGTDPEKNLTFIGLMGMADPPRPESRLALTKARLAGIQIKMITGDYPRTAAAIAREIGLLRPNGKTITGVELDKLSDEKLAKVIGSIDVFARVSPSHKLRVVRALKKNGAIVGMTGDGVNDAPAVKEADIGVAMGKSGTDVTKEAAAMVITDDNFATIIRAIEEGRTIYENIRKFIRYLLSCNIGEILTMFGGIMLGLPLPLLPIQILWVNLVTDGLPAIALGVDPALPGVMSRPPRRPQEGVFSRGLGLKIVVQGILIAGATLAVYLNKLATGSLTEARTAAFAALVLAQLLFVFQCRSEQPQPFQLNFFGNWYLVAATLCSGLMQLAVMTLPWFQKIFHTTTLNATDWLLLIGLTLSVTYCGDLLLRLRRMLNKHLSVFRWPTHSPRSLVGK